MRAILTWHSIDPSGSPISVSSETFRSQIEGAARRGIRIVSVPELLSLDDRFDAASLTFDDGFSNFASEAWPVLKAHGFSATLFVVTDHVGGDNRWRGRGDSGIPTLPLLGWDALGKLAEEGVTIAAHSRTHAHLAGLGDAQLDEELASSAATIERHIGRRAEGFAYPYGEVSPLAAARVAAGYRWACTTDYRALEPTDDVALLPRLDSWYLTRAADFARWGSLRFRAEVWSRRQARRLRASLRRVMS